MNLISAAARLALLTVRIGIRNQLVHSLDACQPGLCALVSAGVRLCRALGAAHGYAAPIRAKGNGHESLGRSGGWGGLVS